MNKFSAALSGVLLMFLAITPAFAAKVETPEALEGVKRVDAAWIKTNMNNAFLADTRKKAVYVRGHIPGAKNIPYKMKSEQTAGADLSADGFKLDKYPQDKGVNIVVYCHAKYCWKSYKAAAQLVAHGYTNVHWFRGGFPEWQEAGYPIE